MSGAVSGPAAKVVLAGAVGLAMFACLPLLPFVAVVGAGSEAAVSVDAAAGGHRLRDGAPVPAAYLAWVLRAGSLCAEIGPAEIAAQLDLESSWNAGAYADSGEVPARGIAQFTDATWQAWGGDYDGDGTNSPYDPEDAIIAQGRLMCDLVAWARNLLAAGTLNGDVLDLAWAAYFDGRGGILAAGGVPAGGPAHDYPDQVRSRLSTYAEELPAAQPAGGFSLPGPDGWVLPVGGPGFSLSSPFGPRGGTFHYGQDFAEPDGYGIVAAHAGIVIEADCTSPTCDRPGGLDMPGCGWTVVVNHVGGFATKYCHARQLLVGVGQPVTAGELLGRVGSTGNSSGPHLHFEVHRGALPVTNSTAIDPLPVLRSVGLGQLLDGH